MAEDIALKEWLDGQEGEYRDKCRYAFAKFTEFVKEKTTWENVNGDLVLRRHTENRKSDDKKVKFYFDDLAPAFVNWVEAKGTSHNYAVFQLGMVRGFFKYHREPLQVIRGKVKTVEVKKRYHAYQFDELVKMVQVGDLEEKAAIMLGVQLGIRVGDFVALKRKPILEAYRNSNGVFPIEFEIMTEKENVISIGHITKEVYDTLQLFWASIPDSDYCFPSNNGRAYISEDRANDIMKNTYSRAYPDRKDVIIRFHELRSYKISILANAGVNEWIIKKLTGKKVSKDINGYLTGVNLREAFTKGAQGLTLIQGPNRNHETLEEVSKLKVEVEERNKQLQTLVNGLSAENLELKSRVSRNELESTELKKRLGRIETALAEWKKELETP